MNDNSQSENDKEASEGDSPKVTNTFCTDKPPTTRDVITRDIYNTSQKLGIIKIFVKVLEGNLLLVTKAAFIWLKIR